jgi:hypothetical protein
MRIALAALITTFAASACGNDIHLTDYQADPPAVYVAKVKNILVGLPPTPDEVAAVQKDPKALGGLVDQWMAMPEYDAKMMVFFELAFQQTQITTANFVDMIPPRGLGIARSLNPLVQNLRESFARTVIAQSAQPFTSSFTTHQFMMTPAVMELYAYLDARRVDDTGTINDIFAKAQPTGQMMTIQYKAGMVDPQKAATLGDPNYLHFYNPDLPNETNYNDPTCDAMDPVTVAVSAEDLHDILYGGIPAHKNPAGQNGCTVKVTASQMGVQMQPSDFTTWKLVTIRPPTGTEKPTNFFDLYTLRNTDTLLVSTPRVGFFSTPAFFANWPTNSSNMARVTVNQSLIVATGTAIDGTDGTNPGANPPGIDTQHAVPGSACYGCHQLLDPTRSIFTATYSYFYYPQTDTNLMKVPGEFAFQGVVQSMKTIDDFAGLLATHPLVPQAWAQKLCYYVDSGACDPADPELQRIIANFAKTNQWNALVKDIVTSSLTTNATETATWQLSGEVVAVSRRDHMCAALNNRLGFNDICQLDATSSLGYGNPTLTVIGSIVQGMPSDGYGRGSTIPVLPNQPTLFYRAALENICEQVAQMTIDAKPSASQPNAKQWSSANATAAIGDFVAIIMALTPSDPRTADVTAALTDHFNAAQSTGGASASDSLKSTFVAACLSPSFIGIGM